MKFASHKDDFTRENDSQDVENWREAGATIDFSASEVRQGDWTFDIWLSTGNSVLHVAETGADKSIIQWHFKKSALNIKQDTK